MQVLGTALAATRQYLAPLIDIARATVLRPSALMGLMLLAATAAVLLPISAVQTLRERTFDAFLAARAPPQPTPPVIVVDLDRATLTAGGGNSISREQLALIVDRIAEAAPAVLAIDMLIEGPDDRSPAALARRLADVTKDAGVAALVDKLPDADTRLAAALRKAPTAVGFVLDPDGAGTLLPPAPILVRGTPDVRDIWTAEGAIGPTEIIAEAAQGFGALVMAADPDGRIRSVPLILRAGNLLRPGLALEAIRLASGTGSYVLESSPFSARLGPRLFAFSRDASLRLRPTSQTRHAGRTLSAQAVLADAAARARIKGAIVFLGSSAPELAGLRTTAGGNLVASVQLHADAASQLLAGDLPYRPAIAGWLEAAMMLGFGGLLVRAGLCWSAMKAAALAIGGGLVWLVLASAGIAFGGWLIDPLAPPVVAGLGYGVAATIAAAHTRRREAAVRRSFEQHLAPEVVRRIVESPGLLRLEGEMREITALFTDIEGFTSMTERSDPRALVRVLDGYIEGASRIVVEHGGMVEKIVGDGLHAIFNAPLDLTNHPQKGLACAEALLAFSEAYRREAEPAALMLGRTRLGLETGLVVVGDVGGGRRLDYTAHGNAMNLAARLEAANKELGTSICIGPEAASRIGVERLTSLGGLAVRGRGEVLEVFTVGPRPAKRS
ncbi:MAG TPA: adenylate/guanylate cyclase domain-containing protein [Hyphomicrobiaceae bacterium]|nr:adenylate/guanylate cyclase domain-containing protein [Hyphomicrobiaceae bacterium]